MVSVWQKYAPERLREADMVLTPKEKVVLLIEALAKNKTMPEVYLETSRRSNVETLSERLQGMDARSALMAIHMGAEQEGMTSEEYAKVRWQRELEQIERDRNDWRIKVAEWLERRDREKTGRDLMKLMTKKSTGERVGRVTIGRV